MSRTRRKLCSNLVSDELLQEIRSIRPLCLYISRQKKRGSEDKPFTLRSQYSKLAPEKKVKYLQKSVDRYIELLDERDVDENTQIECELFDYLLKKSDKKKYFESINAPIKPPGRAIPYYQQYVKQEVDDDMDWDSLTRAEQDNCKRMRKEANYQYSAQVRNFANDLPERLRIDYLSFAEQLPPKPQVNGNSSLNEEHVVESIRQRRKSLTTLPDSLQTTTSPVHADVKAKLTKAQLSALHKCMPSNLYYENDVPDDDKPTFTRMMTKNAYIRSLYHQLDDEERLRYTIRSIKKWNEFLRLHPNIVENQIPTLHLLIPRNEDIVLYFSSLGLPQRPPINSYLLFNLSKDDTNAPPFWTDLSQTERYEYSERLVELKTEYYQNLVQFVEKRLATDYMRYEFLRNVKFAMKDYELAARNDEIINKHSGQFKFLENYKKKTGSNSDVTQFNQIKQRLLATELTDEQINLIEELSDLLYKFIE